MEMKCHYLSAIDLSSVCEAAGSLIHLEMFGPGLYYYSDLSNCYGEEDDEESEYP